MVGKKRRGLADLLQDEAGRLEAGEEEIQTANVTRLQANKLTELGTTELSDLQTDEFANSVSNELPKYLQLVRKEARLREDQYEQLTLLARKLSRASRGEGERITENTLIRVAVDMLLEKQDSLIGSTEEEIKQSYGVSD